MSCYFITECAYHVRVNKKRKENQMIEELLERIVVALEGINATTEMVLNWVAESDGGDISGVYSGTIEAKEMSGEKVIIPPPTHTIPAAMLLTNTREALLARCKELGITVPKGTRTNTLQKWINAGKGGHTRIPEKNKPPVDIVSDGGATGGVCPPSEEEKTPQYSRDDVRVALIALCKKNNNNTQLCRDILKTQGASSVSELDESRFTAIMRDINTVPYTVEGK